jgi:2-isopropylmalate synthase
VNRIPDRLPSAARRELIEKIRRKEEEGYDLAAACGTFELLVREASKPSGRTFDVLHYEVTAARARSRAEVTLEAAGAILTGSATAPGPIHALDLALRRALSTLYASLDRVKLVDYRLHGCHALLQWSDGEKSWTTAGISDNLIEASWLAVLDAVHLEILRTHTIPAPVADYAWAV